MALSGVLGMFRVLPATLLYLGTTAITLNFGSRMRLFTYCYARNGRHNSGIQVKLVGLGRGDDFGATVGLSSGPPTTARQRIS